MNTTKLKLVLLPGLDGTGDLFRDFIVALGNEFEVEIVSYPVNECLSYAALAKRLRASLEHSRPYVLVAESFSTPLAVQIAADQTDNLVGLVLCAGFVSNPVSSVLRPVFSVLAPTAFRIQFPALIARYFLLGSESSPQSIAALQTTVAKVEPQVLATRLRAVLSCNVSESLLRIEVPTLYIRATRDRLVGVSSLKEILRINSRITVETIDGPHLILQQEPERAAAMVTKFIRQI